MRKIDQIRQGDVLLVRADAPLPAECRRVMGRDGQPLAGLRVPGERSGHAHVLTADVYDSPRGRVLWLAEDRELRVVSTATGELALLEDGRPRHQPVTVPAGWWTPIPQRQYSPHPRPSRRAQSRGRWD
jgi:hypothetical protein